MREGVYKTATLRETESMCEQNTCCHGKAGMGPPPPNTKVCGPELVAEKEADGVEVKEYDVDEEVEVDADILAVVMPAALPW